MITVCNDAEINQLKSILLDNLNGMSTNGLLVMMDCAALLFNECKALLRERERESSKKAPSEAAISGEALVKNSTL